MFPISWFKFKTCIKCQDWCNICLRSHSYSTFHSLTGRIYMGMMVHKMVSHILFGFSYFYDWLYICRRRVTKWFHNSYSAFQISMTGCIYVDEGSQNGFIFHIRLFIFLWLAVYIQIYVDEGSQNGFIFNILLFIFLWLAVYMRMMVHKMVSHFLFCFS